MRKFLLAIAACVALVFAVALSSCSKSNADLINDYRDVATELVEAVKNGDAAKIKTLSAQGMQIAEQLKKRDLTPEEQQEILKIAAEMAGAVLPNFSGAQN